MTRNDRRVGSTAHPSSEQRPLVVGLCGSLREQSKTRTALTVVLEAAAERGAQTRLVDLRRFHLPGYDADVGAAGDAARLTAIVDDADSIVLATPNYHGSISGVLKNALDYLGRDEFERKTVGLLEVAGGEYPGSALRHVREVARTLNAWTLPIEVAVPRSGTTIQNGEVRKDDIERRLRDLGAEAVQYAHLDDHPGRREPVAAED